MGKTDVCTKEYISNPQIFADAFNYYFFHGKQVVKPEELTVQDITGIALPHGEEMEGVMFPAQKFRDVLKLWTVMTSKDATYMLLGIENQANVHYAMPVRNMLYDALNYSSQVEETGIYTGPLLGYERVGCAQKLIRDAGYKRKYERNH